MPNELTSAVRAAPRTTRFSLAANYDSELVPKLAAYPVDEVYGKFPSNHHFDCFAPIGGAIVVRIYSSKQKE